MGNIKIIKGVFDTKLELECPIEDVWGIGRRYAAKLQSLGCKTALDFAKHHKFNNINIVRTWQELNGEDAVPNEELAKKKSICISRSFNGMISDKDTPLTLPTMLPAGQT